jgi:hypothetical protein
MVTQKNMVSLAKLLRKQGIGKTIKNGGLMW